MLAFSWGTTMKMPGAPAIALLWLAPPHGTTWVTKIKGLISAWTSQRVEPVSRR